MAEQRLDDRIRHVEEVDVPPEDAFRTFVERFTEWWPAVYTFAGDDLEYIGIEPRAGGRCVERDRQGEELVWGEVVSYEPPERIVFSWWIAPDRTVDPNPDRASEVEVSFSAVDGGRTRIELEHRNLSRHTGDWQMMQAAMSSQEGWPWLLQLYADAVRG